MVHDVVNYRLGCFPKDVAFGKPRIMPLLMYTVILKDLLIFLSFGCNLIILYVALLIDYLRFVISMFYFI